MPIMSDTRDKILELLKQGGAQTAGELSTSLGITPVGTRQHLDRLASDGLVDASEHIEGVGRPRKRWFLTEQGHRTFPDRHENLTVELLSAIRSTFGEDGLDTLLARRTRTQLSRYRAAMPKSGAALGHHVRALARVRSEEGYMASAEKASDGSWRLIENHCPICAAAELCQGLCREELALFRRLLPKGTRIEREKHILAGERRCVYRIQPRG